MSKNFVSMKAGILGGGQLGRMLLQKAADFAISFKVLDPDPSAPCRVLADEFVNGSFNDFDTVYAFGKTCDLLTIEIENVNTQALEKLETEGVLIYPQSKIIRLIQDKGDQKTFFEQNQIPTAPFSLIDSVDELKNIPLPFVQKLRKGGYDGKGVCKIETQEDFKKAFDEPSVAEKLIHFKKEISVIVARNRDGDCSIFPVVEMEFNKEAHLVEYIFSPADISAAVEKKAVTIAIRTANALGIIGLLAVEMFVTENEDVLVNEIAPRPHNSGHHTIEANVTSQYEQHLRAIFGMPLGSTNATSAAVMVNILGELNYEGIASYTNLDKILAMENAHVHLYGKRFTKPFRKMGHVTVTGRTVEEARAGAVIVKELLKVISE